MLSIRYSLGLCIVATITGCGSSENSNTRTLNSSLSTTSDSSKSYNITAIGIFDASRAEFPDNFPPPQVNYRVGIDPLSNIRSWVGHSDCNAPCSGYVKGYPRDQIFSFSNLTIGETYQLIIYPMGSAGASTFSANVSFGYAQILKGGSKTFKTKNDVWEQANLTDHPLDFRWPIVFTAKTNDLSIVIGNGATSGNNYFYFDYLEFLH
ncbi:MAG: hypothetical protein J0L93_07535 [Deltaproteobacteria bacterium]|nr:hypothetical protein [Deltaproteobacteria bacterium]